jgi:predicted kinase
MVVIVFGLPGSGKSYFARKLASKINGEYINSDLVRKEMFDKKTYSEQEKLLVYDEMIKWVNAAVNQYRKVVVDARFYKKDLRTRFVEEVKTKTALLLLKL